MKSTTQGIFIHRISYSETSLIATFYTAEFGLKKFLFKGGKKKSHALFPMAPCELTFYMRSESNLGQLTEAHLLEPMQFQFDPVRASVAYFMAEVLQKCIPEGEKDLPFFEFILNASHALNVQSSVQLLPITFLIGLIDSLGIQPLIEDENASVFNIDDGTLQSYVTPSTRCFEGESVRLIRVLLQKQDLSLHHKEIRAEALDMLMDYIKIHIVGFNSLASYDIIREVLSV